ncbi:TonB-dependent receptor [Aquabacterium sp. J223]|uniref:TonB-dependent receptor n=1 Tax=Aquabacterium sp. J223 TaxID=2898431 RepID=UPI0021AD818D|nr:TonB-dependent receptor [Aquabacterium sp. J223]UUX96410.1 TonB-dependent receptor [Aquabacterium sp. J223]
MNARSPRRLRLSATAAAAGLLVLHQAHAQPEPAAAGSAGSGGRATLQTVEVTAQKTVENPLRIPGSVSAIGGDDLQASGINNAVKLREAVTGVAVVEQGPAASIQIRGVGSNPGGGNIDPSVALSFDGVYQSRGGSAFGSFFDLERVEVLKGPQGTLYGRNATVGAVNVISRRPTSRLEGEVTVEVGNYDLRRGMAAVNVPLNDMLRMRLAAQKVKRDGYLSDGYNDADDEAARFKLLLEPNKGFSALLTLDHYHRGGNGGGNIFTGTIANFNANGTPRVNPAVPWTNADTQVHTPARDSGNPWTLTPVVPTPCTTPGCYNAPATTGLNSANHAGTGHAEPPNGGLKIANDGAALEVNADLGGATLTVLPAWRRSYVANQSGTSGNLLIPAYSIIDQEQRSVEVRLASAAARRLRWLVGGFWIDENAPTTQIARSPNSATLTTGTSTYTSMSRVHAVSKSLFGQTTWAATESLRLTTGLRYTRDDKDQNGNIYCRSAIATDGSGANCAGLWAPYANANIPVATTFGDSAVNYKVGLDYDLDKSTMVYAAVSTGYKSGGLNFMPDNGLADSRARFKPEKLTALSMGGKGRALDGRLQYSAELFHWLYRDQQVAIVDQFDRSGTGAASPVANLLFINNPGPSKITGIDLDAAFAVTNNDRINASLALLRARNGSFKINATQFVIPTGPSSSLYVPLEAATDVSGRTLPFSPTLQLNLGYTRYFDLSDGAIVTFTIDGHYETASYVNYHLYDPQRQPAYFRGDLGLGYTSQSGRFSLNGWVRNVTNVAVITRGAVGGGAGGSAPAHYANIADPRTYGVTATFRF